MFLTVVAVAAMTKTHFRRRFGRACCFQAQQLAGVGGGGGWYWWLVLVVVTVVALVAGFKPRVSTLQFN